MAQVLVVDDDAAVRDLLAGMLSTRGHTAIEAADGEEALRLFRTQPVDLVICDLIMPVREGLETILELKRLDADVRVIAISGGGQGTAGDYLEVAVHLGAQRTLAKPFRKRELLDAVDGVLAAP